MSEAHKIFAETQRWLDYAQRDLEAAQALIQSGNEFAPQICFLSQQAAEKGLKAALIFLQIDFPFRHDLELLTTLFPADWGCSQLSNVSKLTEWAVESRYPSDLPDPSGEDAQLALQKAEEIMTIALDDLTQHGFPESR